MELCGYYDIPINYRSDVITLLLQAYTKLEEIVQTTQAIGKLDTPSATVIKSECHCAPPDFTNIESKLDKMTCLQAEMLSTLLSTQKEELPSAYYYEGNNSFKKSKCYECTLGPDECKNPAITWHFTPSGWVAGPYGSNLWSRHILG